MKIFYILYQRNSYFRLSTYSGTNYKINALECIAVETEIFILVRLHLPFLKYFHMQLKQLYSITCRWEVIEIVTRINLRIIIESLIILNVWLYAEPECIALSVDD